ncbi:hypothetical protein [uncultured Pseudodesulfovibrio sp.]|uniref:hypothetical protein n=1 Tax=uncultured Pseudodesulfovibrio sp. TaxID=2035858 RepID=UPI0029C64497|nr:hypothetical protein [uncultured Pseudodesulfovibrio sp.]
MNLLKSILVKILLWVATLGSFVFCCYYFYVGFLAETDSEMTLYVTYATLLLIASITCLQFACTSLYNSMNDMVKMVSNPKQIGLDAVFDAFKELDTALGQAWIGKVKTIRNKVIIFGPNADGEYIYIDTFGKGSINVAFNDRPSFLKPGEEDKWRLEPQPGPESLEDVIRYTFVTACILPELAKRVQEFVNTGIADLTPLGIDQNEKIYIFDEDFSWVGQEFTLYDIDQNEMLKVDALVPCKTFSISEPEGEEELFGLTKRIFHIMPTYDLFEKGRKIGRLKKRFIFDHVHFVGDTTLGRLELRSMNATIGSNYQVKLDGKQIGTVARKLNIDLGNIVFDNFVISVRDPRYLPLMAGMAVMVARQAQRDKVETAVTLADD